MNLDREIANIFEDKNHNDLFKVRWLYLYLCKTFSYDTRFMYGKENLKEEIYNKIIDIKDVEDFEIVCYTISRILIDVLTSYGYDCEMVRENNNKFSHVYAIVKCKDYVIKLDPTKRHDLTRVKMNSNTLDFSLLNDNTKFNDELLETDTNITNNYNDIDKSIFYDNETIEKLVKVIEEGAQKRNISECELFYEKIEYLFSLINTRTDLKRYDDMDYYFSYLIKKFKLNDIKPRIKPGVFFKNDDESMKDIINISIIKYDDMPPIFYLLKKEGTNFKAGEIYKNEAIELLRQYNNPVCQLIFENTAMLLSDENKKISF